MIHNPPGYVKTRILMFASLHYRRKRWRRKPVTRHPPFCSDKLSRLAPPSESIERRSPYGIKNLAAGGGMAPILLRRLTYELPRFGLSCRLYRHCIGQYRCRANPPDEGAGFSNAWRPHYLSAQEYNDLPSL